MGCLCPPKPGIPEKINQLERLRSSVLSTIEVNKVKMETLENNIQQMDKSKWKLWKIKFSKWIQK